MTYSSSPLHQARWLATVLLPMADEPSIVYHKVRQITITIAITYLNNFGGFIL
jgi:hypothetical protein